MGEIMLEAKLRLGEIKRKLTEKIDLKSVLDFYETAATTSE